MENNTPLTPEMQMVKDYVMTEINKLTSRISTLKTENETLNKFLDESTENHHKLMRLLHTQVTKRAHDQNAHPTNTEAIWQRYCEENNIKINP